MAEDVEANVGPDIRIPPVTPLKLESIEHKHMKLKNNVSFIDFESQMSSIKFESNQKLN